MFKNNILYLKYKKQIVIVIGNRDEHMIFLLNTHEDIILLTSSATPIITINYNI